MSNHDTQQSPSISDQSSSLDRARHNAAMAQKLRQTFAEGICGIIGHSHIVAEGTSNCIRCGNHSGYDSVGYVMLHTSGGFCATCADVYPKLTPRDFFLTPLGMEDMLLARYKAYLEAQE